MALKLANQPILLFERIGILALGLTTNAMMVYGYDFVVYPYLIATYGLLFGWSYAILGSIFLCLGTLWFYDLTKQDWIGIEAVKLLRDGEVKWSGRYGWFGITYLLYLLRRSLRYLLNKGDLLVFFVLSLKFDAFITIAYMRKGVGNHIMSTRDWKIFWASIIVSNAWWGMVVFGVIEFARHFVVPHLFT